MPVPGYLRIMGKLISLCLILISGTVSANDWDALQEPGALAIMRHALAPGTGDPAGFRVDDCSTQRNLDARGRAQARAIGAAFAARGIAFDAVYSSQWCRTRETAELVQRGRVADWPSLNSFFADFSTRDAQTRQTRTRLRQNAGQRLLLVSHQVNISALTGRGTRSGEVLIVRLEGDAVRVLGSILIAP